jgi:hypothetical protein
MVLLDIGHVLKVSNICISSQFLIVEIYRGFVNLLLQVLFS